MALLSTCLYLHAAHTSLLLHIHVSPTPLHHRPSLHLSQTGLALDTAPFPFRPQERAQIFYTTEASLPVSLSSKTIDVSESGQ